MTIPNSVARIEGFAFYDCWGLTSVTIGKNVSSIGDQAFVYCFGLTSITCLGNAPALGGGSVFAYVNGGAKVYYYSGTSGWGATYGGLPAIMVEDFTYATNNGAITITAYTGPDGAVVIPAMTNGYPVVSIGPRAFYGKTGVTSVTIPNSVTNIAGFAFSRCTSLTSVTIGNSVTSIGDAAFYLCTSLTSVIIGNSLTSIGWHAFSGCTSLTGVTIPNSVTSIGGAAFSRCTSLTNLSVDAAHPVYSTLNGVLLDKAQTTLIMYPPGRGGSYVIPDSVTSIGGGAFDGCASLTSVTIPNSVSRIGWSAFEGGTSLTSVIIPNSVTIIEDWAFEGCTNLTNFTFLGNAPELIFYPTHPDDYSGDWFSGVGAGARAYYYCGTTGWGATYGGLPTVMLFAPRVAPGSAGVKPGGFGFTLTCLTNQTVVEASANLVNWQPIWTNTLFGASADFVDPQWVNHPRRFYRARSN